MSRYLVTLKPIGTFFFGNERNFGYGKENENYIVRSNYFPQQTSILGMIRKEVLKKSGRLKEFWEYTEEDKKENEELIGKESFQITKNEQNFGIIREISPVVLCEGDDIYIKIPKDHKIQSENGEKENENYTPLKISTNKIKTSIGEIALPINFKSKEGISKDFINIKNQKIISSGSVFIEDSRVGIKIGENKKTDEEAFYKLVSFRLSNNFKFVFEVDIHESSNEKIFDEYQGHVNLGGEGSMFKISFKEIQNSFIDNIKKFEKENESYRKIVLLSDTYIEGDVYEHCDFAISGGVDFRNVITKRKHNKEYRDNNNRFQKINKKYTFLERGSVLYTSNYDELINKIDHYKNLKTIGYNIYK